MKDVIEAPVTPCPLDRQDIERFLYHAYSFPIAGVADTYATWIDLRDVLANRAQSNAFLDLDDRLRQGLRVGHRCAKHVIRETLCALRPNAGKLVELLDQPREWRGRGLRVLINQL